MVATAGLSGCDGQSPRGGQSAVGPTPNSPGPEARFDPPPTGPEFGTEDIADSRPQALRRSRLTVGPHSLTVEIADTPGRRAKGLMYRTALPPKTGMIFLYPQADDSIKYWNQNVPIALDVAFCTPDGTIVKIAGMKPFDPTSLAYQGPPAVSVVLEMPAGWFAENAVKVGDRLELSEALKAHRPR